MGTLLASAAVSLSFAASSASAETSGLIKAREIRCAESAARDAEEQPNVQVQQGLAAMLCEFQAEEDDRSYLLETASPGSTMERQGPETAIARLNPEFVARLVDAIRDARDSGLPSAGIFSAYRPPAFGVGGFSNKFRSLHSYGLAVDMSGIGDPGSKDAKLWHEIAARHGVFCPYGANSRTEWNHCQATPTKGVSPDGPLRKTITAEGPIALEEMFKVGEAVIDDTLAAIGVAVAANRREDADSIRSHATRVARVATLERRRHLDDSRNVGVARFARAKRGEKTRTLTLAANLRRGEKSRLEARESRKAERRSEGRRTSPHHRSHLA
jgi:hypothetical protein